MIQKPLFWHQGLFLQPQHFQLLEQSLRGTLTPFNDHTIPFLWGVADLEISRTAIPNKMLDVLRGVFLFPDGTYVALPGNAVINSRFFDDSWAGRLNVYLGIKTWNESGVNVTVKEAFENLSSVTTRFAALELPEEVQDMHAGGPAGRVKRMSYVLKILWEDELKQADDYVVIPIAQLTKLGSDVRLSEDYIAPCVNLTGSGSLFRLITEVRDQVTSRAYQLEEYKKKRGVHTAEFGSRDMVYVLALRTLSRYVPLLHNYIETKQVHPWMVYGALRQLIGELSVFSDRVNILGELTFEKKVVIPAYNHRALYECFSSAQDMISHLLDELTAGADYIISLSHDGTYYTSDLKPSIFEGRNRFYLSIRTEQSFDSVLEAIKTVVKVGSREDMRVIVSRALPGLNIEHQTQIPKELPYRTKTSYFLIGINNEQWDSVERTRNLAIHWSNPPDDLEIELMVVGR